MFMVDWMWQFRPFRSRPEFLLVRPSGGFSRAKPVSGGETGNWQIQSLNSDWPPQAPGHERQPGAKPRPIRRTMRTTSPTTSQPMRTVTKSTVRTSGTALPWSSDI